MPFFTFSKKIFFLSLALDGLVAAILVAMVYLTVGKHALARTYAVPTIVLMLLLQFVKAVYFLGVLIHARRWSTLAVVGTYLVLNGFVWYWMLFVLAAMLGTIGITPDGTEHRY
jgi:hypothetical protein